MVCCSLPSCPVIPPPSAEDLSSQEDVAVSKPHKVIFIVRISLGLDNTDVLPNSTPSDGLNKATIRYTFLGDKNETTPEIGAGWKEADLGGGKEGRQWEKSYGPILADRDFALGINSKPFILFTLADKAEGERTTAVLPRGGGSTSTNPTSASMGRNFLYQVMVDISPLLTSQSVAVVIDNTSTTSPPNPCLPKGLHYLKIEVILDQPLLNMTLLNDLNPMTIHLRDVKGLPGLRIDTLSDQKYLLPNRYHLLNQHCHPIYAAMMPFEDTTMFPRPAFTAITTINQ